MSSSSQTEASDAEDGAGPCYAWVEKSQIPGCPRIVRFRHLLGKSAAPAQESCGHLLDKAAVAFERSSCEDLAQKAATAPEQADCGHLPRKAETAPAPAQTQTNCRDLPQNTTASPQQTNCRLKVYYSGPLSVLIQQVFSRAGYRPTEAEGVPRRFNACWGAAKFAAFYQALSPGQIINQWPGSAALGNKAVMGRAAAAAFRRNAEFCCFPPTYVVPAELVSLDAKMRARPDYYFIYKPANANRGEGIRLLKCGDYFNRQSAAVVQRYLDKPLLIEQHKFDLRIYVLITSIDPLIVYVHRRGLARFAARPYRRPTRRNKAENTVHLTNYSVNKNADQHDFETKWELCELLDYIQAHSEALSANADIFSGDVRQNIWDRIIKTVQLGILVAEPKLCAQAHAVHVAHAFPRRNFGLYGFDVFITQAGKFYLLEMNISPSTATGSALDQDLKSQLLVDTLDLVGMHAFARPPKFDNAASFVRQEYYLPRPGEFCGFQLESGEAKISDQTCKGPLDWNELTRFEKRCLWQIRDEETRLGGYQRVFPAATLRHLFETPRYLNCLAECYVEHGLIE